MNGFTLTDYIYSKYLYTQTRTVKEGLASRKIFYYNKSYTQFHKMGKLGILFSKKVELKATFELSGPQTRPPNRQTQLAQYLTNISIYRTLKKLTNYLSNN